MNLLKPDETLDDLVIGGYKVIQGRKGYRFSMDSILLADFAAPGKNDQVLDLGCGCGIISILMACREPECVITGLELQESLADRARRSVELNQLQGRVKIINGDLHDAALLGPENFNLVVANPPFFKVGEGRPSAIEEKLIARHEVQATLGDFIFAASRFLGEKGRLALIQPASRLAEIVTCCQGKSLVVKRIRTVHPRQEKPANLVLVDAQKDGKPGLTILPPLIVYGDDGRYSEELMRIYFGV